MLNNYAESKRTLDDINQKFCCKGDVIFRTALQYLMEYGQERFADDAWVDKQLRAIDLKHDHAEARNKILWVSRDFERAIIECAKEMASVDTYNLLIYIQKEVWLSNEGGIDYGRAIELLKSCMIDIEQRESCEDKLTLYAFEDIGFEEDEIQTLGWGYLYNAKEEEYND